MENTSETPIPATPPAPAPAENGQYAYFQKVMVNMPFFVNRVPVQFEPLSRNVGVLKIESANPLVTALTAAAISRKGGIILIDAANYEELKKKLPFNLLAQKSKQHVLQVFQTNPSRKNTAGANAAGANSRISGKGNGVAPVGGRGTGERTGMPTPVPVPPPAGPGEFQPSVGKKNFKMPVIKKTESRSLSGGVDEPEPAD